MRILFESLESLHFLPLLLLAVASPTCLFLPKQTLPFEMLFVPLSVDCFRLKLDHELVK